MVRRRKDSMALFEVVAPGDRKKRKATMTVPDWMKRSHAPGGAQEAPQPTETPQPEALPDVEPAANKRPDRAHVVWSTADGRVTVSLNYVSCGVAAMGVVLALVAMFMLGRASRGQVPPGQPEGNKAPAQAGPVSGKVPQRISGKYYLVIQQLGGRTAALKADANAIAAYCLAARGDSATVIDDGQQYLVLSGRPFDRQTSGAALEYAADIHHTLGKRYKTDENSKYDFNQMDSRGLLDPWFEAEP